MGACVVRLIGQEDIAFTDLIAPDLLNSGLNAGRNTWLFLQYGNN